MLYTCHNTVDCEGIGLESAIGNRQARSRCDCQFPRRLPTATELWLGCGKWQINWNWKERPPREQLHPHETIRSKRDLQRHQSTKDRHRETWSSLRMAVEHRLHSPEQETHAHSPCDQLPYLSGQDRRARNAVRSKYRQDCYHRGAQWHCHGRATFTTEDTI